MHVLHMASPDPFQLPDLGAFLLLTEYILLAGKDTMALLGLPMLVGGEKPESYITAYQMGIATRLTKLTDARSKLDDAFPADQQTDMTKKLLNPSCMHLFDNYIPHMYIMQAYTYVYTFHPNEHHPALPLTIPDCPKDGAQI